MVNRHRGEISATLDGKEWEMCLTLGALAELEAAFETDDLTALTTRFSNGKFSSSDMLKIIGAGLRGAGHLVTDDELGEMQAEEGAVGYARIVTDLLTATFGRSRSSDGQLS